MPRACLASTEKNAISTAIENEISQSLERSDISIDATSGLSFDSEYQYATFKECVYTKNGDGSYAELIRMDSERVVVGIASEVTCEVVCDFEFYAYDSIDKENIKLGNNSYTITHVYDTEVLVTLVGPFADGLSEVDVEEVEVLQTPDSVDFGDISIDWGEQE